MKKLIHGFTLILIAAGLAACNQAPSQNDSRPRISVKDAKYGDQDVPIDPQRIVAFDYGALDTISALGSESKVVGLPKSNLPEILHPFADAKYANVGNLFEPNFELLFTLKPDLIIVSGRAAAKIPELRKLAPTIYVEVKNEDYYNSFKANTTLLGKILNKDELVKQKLAEVDTKLDALAEKSKSSNKNALIALYTSGKVSVYGPKSRFGVLHQAFGIRPADPNIQESNNGQVITFEFFKKTDPDYIFVIDRAKIIGEETLAQSFFDNDVVKSTKAYKSKGLIFLNTEIWYTVSGGIQSMTHMIEEISKVVDANLETTAAQ